MTFHPLDPRHTADPHPRVAAWHADGHRLTSPMPGCHVVARDVDVRTVLGDPALFSSRANNTAVPHPDAELALSQLDPPTHTRVRGIVRGVLGARAVAAMEPAVRDHAARAVDRVRQQLAAHGEADLVAEVTGPYPVAVLACLLGSTGEERALVTGWVAEFATLVGQQSQPGWPAFRDRVDGWIRARRADPDAPADLITALVRGGGADGGGLGDVEIRTFVHFLLVAGVRNVGWLIGNALHRLFTEGWWSRLAAEPGLAADVVEESLRHDPPALWSMRTATADTTIGDTTIAAGDAVFTLTVGANLDPDRWEAPNVFRPGRPGPRGHLAFGHGPHLCLGAELARLEARTVLAGLATTLPDLQLAPGFTYRRGGDLMSRGPATLPVVRGVPRQPVRRNPG